MANPTDYSDQQESTGTASSGTNTPKQPISLRKNVMWTGLGNGVYLASKYLLFCVLAKLGSPVIVGQYAYAQALTTPPITFSQLQLRVMQATDSQEEYSFAEYFTTRLLLTVVAFLVILGLAVSCDDSPQMRVVILLVGIANAFESMSDVVYGRLQKHERMKLMAISLIIKGVASAIVFAALIGLLHSLLHAVAGLAFAWGSLFFFYDLPNARRLAKTDEALLVLRLSAVWRLLIAASPLAASSGFISLTANLPRYCLEHFSGKAAVGFFTVAGAPVLFATAFCSAIAAAALPRVARYYQEGKIGAFKSLVLRVSALQIGTCLGITLAFALVGKLLLTVLFRAEYARWTGLALLLSGGVSLGYLSAFGSFVLYSARAFKVQFLVAAIHLIIQTPVVVVLASRWGLVGAAWAELVRYGVGVLLLTVAGGLILSRRTKALAAEIPHGVQSDGNRGHAQDEQTPAQESPS